MAMTWRPPPGMADRLTATAFLTGRPANEIMSEAIGAWLAANEPDDIEQVIAARARTSAAKQGDTAEPDRPPADYVPYGERRPYTVADNLDDLTGPTTGTLELPNRIDWSGSPTVDLDQPGNLIEMYRTILTEALRVDDLNAFLNRAQLVAFWPHLVLPAKVRRMWEDRFPELAPTSRKAA